MAAIALEGLIAREEALIAALDAGDVGALENATQDMTRALVGVAAAGGWHESPELGMRLTQALRLAEATGARIHYLADDNRRRVSRLMTLSGRPRAEGYGRSGRLA